MKFPTDNGVGEIEGNQDTARDFYVTELWENRKRDKGKGVEAALCIKNSEA